MGLIRPAPPACFLCGVILPAGEDYSFLRGILADEFGAACCEGGPWPFAISYYEKEMGLALERRFFALGPGYDPSVLADDKIRSNALEDRLRRDGVRRVNLDPGYLTHAQLVLASTKNNVQRVWLRDGIYAEVTLHWQKGRWHPFPWTYVDYRSGIYNEFLDRVRQQLARR